MSMSMYAFALYVLTWACSVLLCIYREEGRERHGRAGFEHLRSLLFFPVWRRRGNNRAWVVIVVIIIIIIVIICCCYC